ncbi:hypothetical protein FKP32DRAFT_1674680 [Trametes sanguinea]|nr:hypothetical protein FKP32DRAFT_1674680 [Trametes sanguinea]
MSSPPVATAPPPPRTTPPTPNVERLKGLLKQTLRVTVTDGRIFIGTFAGTDKQLNILLISADEYRVGPDAGPDGADGRYVGQVMVPWRLVVRVEARMGNGQMRAAYGDASSDEDGMRPIGSGKRSFIVLARCIDFPLGSGHSHYTAWKVHTWIATGAPAGACVKLPLARPRWQRSHFRLTRRMQLALCQKDMPTTLVPISTMRPCDVA